MAPITTVSKTQIDVNTGKVIPWANNLTAPKGTFGTEPEEHK
jgi:hypothetical protein